MLVFVQCAVGSLCMRKRMTPAGMPSLSLPLCAVSAVGYGWLRAAVCSCLIDMRACLLHACGGRRARCDCLHAVWLCACVCVCVSVRAGVGGYACRRGCCSADTRMGTGMYGWARSGGCTWGVAVVWKWAAVEASSRCVCRVVVQSLRMAVPMVVERACHLEPR